MVTKDDLCLLSDSLSDFEIHLILSDLPREFQLGQWRNEFQQQGFLVVSREIILDCEEYIFQVGRICEVRNSKVFQAFFSVDMIGGVNFSDYIIDCDDSLLNLSRRRQLFEVTVIDPDASVRHNIFHFHFNRIRTTLGLNNS